MAVCFVQGDEAWVEQELSTVLVVQRLVHTWSLLRLLTIRVLPVLTLADGNTVWLVVLVGPTASEATLPFHLVDECDLVGTDDHGLFLRRNGRPIDRAESGSLHCLPL